MLYRIHEQGYLTQVDRAPEFVSPKHFLVRTEGVVDPVNFPITY